MALLTRLLPVLEHQLYARYMAGNALSLLGLWVQRVGLGWLTWELTESGFWLGVVAFADLFPALVLGPFAGVWADRMDRVRLLRVTQLISGVLAAILFVLSWLGAIHVYLLTLLALALGCAASVAQPARLALVPLLVPARDMGAAVALGSVAFNTARFVGPMIAGVLIAAADVSYTFLFNAATFFGMAAVLLAVPTGLHEIKATESHVLEDIGEGIGYTLRHPAIRVVMLVILAVAVLGKPVAELLPGFADRVFQRDAIGLALMTQAMGIGALLGGIALARAGAHARMQVLTAATLLATGVLAIVFGNVDRFDVALGVLFIFSMALSATGICTQTLVQHAVDESMRGRVMSIWGLIFRGAPAIGVLLMGWGSEYSSLPFVVAVGGGVCVVMAALVARPLIAANLSPEPAGQG